MRTNWTGSAGDPVWIRPEWPTDRVRGIFSFREGGVSEAPYQSLNVGYHVGDDAAAVTENRRRCAEAIGANLEDLVVPEQVHGAGVAVVTEAHRGRGSTPSSPPIAGVDGVVSNVPGLALTIMAADCVPMLFYDAKAGVIGAAHSGWRGTVSHISREVLRTMSEAFGSRPQDVDVWLGPSIRRCCYEVDDRVAEPVMESFGRGPLLPRHARPGKYLFSQQACIRLDLLSAGVTEEHIHDVGVCTACHTHLLYSHRAEQGKTGRLLGAIRLG